MSTPQVGAEPAQRTQTPQGGAEPAEGSAEALLARGLALTIQPALSATDEAVRDVLKSQSDLINQIDAFNANLAGFNAKFQGPTFDAYVQKLSSARKRVFGVTNSIRTIQERLDRLGELYAAVSAKKGAAAASAPAASATEAAAQ
eukprot:tig00020553_g10687.t1